MKKSSFYFSLKNLFELKHLLLVIVIFSFTTHAYKDFLYKPDLTETYVEAFIMFLATYLLIKEIVSNYELHSELVVARDLPDTLSLTLNEMIEEKYKHWQLSPSEKEVATLIIQGLLIKEIAFKRSVSEKTVQSQLTSIYKKSKSKNRADFTTQFIQNIL